MSAPVHENNFSVADKSMDMRSALVSAILVSDPYFDQRAQPKNKRRTKKGKKKGQTVCKGQRQNC